MPGLSDVVKLKERLGFFAGSNFNRKIFLFFDGRKTDMFVK